MKTDRKPPLAKSPMRLRTLRALRPTNTKTPLRTPMGSLAKTQMKESKVRLENNSVSFQLKALGKMVHDELGVMSAQVSGFGNVSNIDNSFGGVEFMSEFKRGRFYDEYSARRNERLMKKHNGGGNEEPKVGYNLGVKVESAKKDINKTESLMKYASVDRSQHPRYALRSTTKKPPLPVPMYAVVEKTTARKTTASRASRK